MTQPLTTTSSGYRYENEKAELLSESGQRLFLDIRDRVKELLAEAGAFRMQEAMADTSGSTWQMIAAIERLVELGEIIELQRPNKRQCWTQFRVFTDGACYG